MATNERQLPFTLGAEFFIDPVFSECWKRMEAERFLPERERTETGGIFLETEGDPIVALPFKWNNLGRMMEFVRNVPAHDDQKSSEVETWRYSYKILLDVQHFVPSELSINLTDRTIVIKGKHDERDDPNGAVSREFSRKYIVPADVHMDRIECNLSSDGVLHISAPRKSEAEKKQHTGIGTAIKESFSTLIDCVNPNVYKETITPDESSKSATPVNGSIPETSESEPREIVKDEPIRRSSIIGIEGLPDFDCIPFWTRRLPQHSHFGIKSDKDMFRVRLDVRKYNPSQLLVYTEPHHIFVEGTHEDNKDGDGFTQNYFHFTRKYYLPRGVDSQYIRCEVTQDGVLEITAPKSDFFVNNMVGESVIVPIIFKETGEAASPVSEDTGQEIDRIATDLGMKVSSDELETVQTPITIPTAPPLVLENDNLNADTQTQTAAIGKKADASEPNHEIPTAY